MRFWLFYYCTECSNYFHILSQYFNTWWWWLWLFDSWWDLSFFLRLLVFAPWTTYLFILRFLNKLWLRHCLWCLNIRRLTYLKLCLLWFQLPTWWCCIKKVVIKQDIMILEVSRFNDIHILCLFIFFNTCILLWTSYLRKQWFFNFILNFLFSLIKLIFLSFLCPSRIRWQLYKSIDSFRYSIKFSACFPHHFFIIFHLCFRSTWLLIIMKVRLRKSLLIRPLRWLMIAYKLSVTN